MAQSPTDTERAYQTIHNRLKDLKLLYEAQTGKFSDPWTSGIIEALSGAIERNLTALVQHDIETFPGTFSREVSRNIMKNLVGLREFRNSIGRERLDEATSLVLKAMEPAGGEGNVDNVEEMLVDKKDENLLTDR